MTRRRVQLVILCEVASTRPLRAASPTPTAGTSDRSMLFRILTAARAVVAGNNGSESAMPLKWLSYAAHRMSLGHSWL